jgi:acyl carrier protein
MELEEFIQHFANQFDDTDVAVFNAGTNYQDLEEWSSMTMLSVIACVRTNYGKKITASDLRSCSTIEELFNLVKQR